MKITLLRSMLVVGAFLCFAMTQAQEVTGTVSDANGPLPGASVVVKGTNSGTQTDFDGNFTIEAANDATLVISYVGFKTQEIGVNGQSTVNATLLEDAEALEEVVVIGYGTTTVKDATGSVTAVTSEDFNGGIISSPEQLIQGKTAGVQISQSSGEPGAGIAIRIRGSNSIRSNNNPLFVVDGVPLSDESTTPNAGGIVDGGDSARNSLNFLNPNDIESMSILKDGSATAIYGSRGANGVVIITTKSGKAGQGGTFEFSSNLSISAPASRYDLFNAADYRAETAALGGSVPAIDDSTGSDTDWQDVITRTVASTNNNIAYSKNYGQGNLRATFSYANQLGVIEKSGQERVTGRLNLAHRLFDDKVRVSIQASLSRVEDQAPQISGGSGASGNLIGAAYSAPPTWPNNSSFTTGDNRLNPANVLENYEAKGITDRLLVNGSAEIDIIESLTGKVSLGYDNSKGSASAVVSPNYLNNGVITGNGAASYNTLNATSELLEATLNYNKDLGGSNIDLLAGYSYQNFRRQGYNSQGRFVDSSDLNEMFELIRADALSSSQSVGNEPYQQFGYDGNGNNFLNSIIPFDNTGVFGAGGTRNYGAFWLDSFDNTDELQSFFGRLNYTLNNKYIFTGTFRADGSSRFGPENQYGYFPSGAFAWKLTEEDFVGENISTLKLRLSAGVTGNQGGLGYAQFAKRQRFGGPGISNDGTIVRPGIETVAEQEDRLRWESTTDFNVGLDFGFNDDRLRGSFDVYRKETNDLLFFQSAAAPAFAAFKFGNLENGTVINQGVELALGYDLLQTDKSSFSVDFNIAYNDNSVEGLNGTTADFGVLNGPGLTGAFAQRLGEGRSLFSYYMAEYSEDASGVPNFDGTDKDFVDKDALPDITTGLALNYRSGNFDASAFFTGQFGFYIYNNTANAFLNQTTFKTARNATPDGLELTTQEISTLYLEKGDFVRFQNLSVGYNVPLSGEGLFKSMRLSLNGQNLAVFSGYSGLDPEVSSNTGDLGSGIPSAGIDYTSFPRPRTFTLGLNAKF